MFIKKKDLPDIAQELDVMMCGLHTEPARPRAKYIISHTTNEGPVMIKEVVYKIDINSYERNNEDKDLMMNDIARVKVRSSNRLMIDSYRDNRNTGSVIFIDEATNETVAAGMVV